GVRHRRPRNDGVKLTAAESQPVAPPFGAGAERVLLLNPPVIDSRLLWARWIQPIPLLRLAGYFKSIGVDTKLVDALGIGSRVRIRRQLADRRSLDGTMVNLWRFGLSASALRARLRELA